MNILDEDIDLYQRQRLEAKRTHVRQIGVEIGRVGMKDRNGVIPALHALRRPTFFTRDHGFYHPDLRHPQYCLVYLDVARKEVSDYVRLFLRHPSFRTQAQRMGKVVRVRHSGLSWWEIGGKAERAVSW